VERVSNQNGAEMTPRVWSEPVNPMLNSLAIILYQGIKR
jgi:hypothetical protein